MNVDPVARLSRLSRFSRPAVSVGAGRMSVYFQCVPNLVFLPKVLDPQSMTQVQGVLQAEPEEMPNLCPGRAL